MKKNKKNNLLIPTTFESGGFTIEVYYDPKMIYKEKADIGLNCLGSQEIYVQPPVKDRISEEVCQQAFLHELVHQLTWQMGRSDLCHDEVFVDGFAHGLFQFMKTAKGDLLSTWQNDLEKEAKKETKKKAKKELKHSVIAA